MRHHGRIVKDERIVAAILAGGRSSRFGAPKALAELAGRPLVAHVAEALAGAAELAVIGDEAAARAVSAVRLVDPPHAASGPLAGVLAGLEWASLCGADWLCVAPCDAPLLPVDLVAHLRTAAAGAPLASVVTDAGAEPLISMWRVALLPDLRSALSGGAHPAAHRLLERLGAAPLQLDAQQTLNVNTREDFARAEAALLARP